MFKNRIIDYLIENWPSVVIGFSVTVLGGLILFFIKNYIKKRKGKRIGIKEEKNTIIKGRKAPKSDKAKLANNKEQEYVIDTIRISNQGTEDITIGKNDCIIIESSKEFDITNVVPNTELGLMDLRCNCLDNKRIRISWDTLKTDDSICISIFAKQAEDCDIKIPFIHFFDCLQITNFISGVYVVKKRKSIAKFKSIFIASIVFLLSCASGIHYLPKMNNYLDGPMVFQIESKRDTNMLFKETNQLLEPNNSTDSIVFASIRYDHELCPQLVINTIPTQGVKLLKTETSIEIDKFNNNYNYRIISTENDNALYFYRSSVESRIIKLWMIIVAASLFLVFCTYRFYK